LLQLTCDNRSNAQHQLLQASDPTSDRRMGDFCLIHWHDHDEDTNTKPTDSPTGIEE
jgi:hypothetical protein